MFEPSAASAPKRSSFPSPASVNHENGGVIKSRKCVSTDRMRQMMIHESKLRPRRSKMPKERFLAASLPLHGRKMPGGIQKIVRAQAARAAEIIAQVVQKSRARRLPAEANEIELGSLDAGEIQQGLNSARGKTGVMLLPAQSLFGNSE